MKYLTIDHIDDSHLNFVRELYITAFPPKERREWDILTGMIGTVPEMHVQVILEKVDPIGFITLWKLSDWCFIEHFAISPERRGKKYGEKVMLDILKDQEVILEVEPSVSNDARRRIKFYERAGMDCLSFPYLQPSYKPDGKPYKMALMSNVADAAEEEYKEVVNLIFQKVYNSAARV